MSDNLKYISYDWNLTPPRSVKAVYQDGQWGEEIPDPPPKSSTHLRIEVVRLSSGPELRLFDDRELRVIEAHRFEAEVEFTLYLDGGASRSATFLTSANDNGWLQDDDARAELLRNWRLDNLGWVDEGATGLPDYDNMSVEIIDRNDFLKWLGLDLTAIFKQQANEQQQPAGDQLRQPLRLTPPPEGSCGAQ